MASNNEELRDRYGSGGYFLDSGAFLTVNHNFLSAIPVLDHKGQPVRELAQDRFYCLIPENKQQHTQRIQEEIMDQILLYQDFFKDRPTAYTTELEIKYIQSDQRIFNFNAENPRYSLSENPVIFVLALPILDKQIGNWLAEVSQGHYLFKDQETVQTFIEENGFENEFLRITSAKDTANQMYVKAKSDYQMSLLVFILLLLIFVLVESYVSLIYVEVEKKRLFLQYIIGEGFWTRHGAYSVNMLGISLISLLILVMIRSSYVFVALAVLFFECIMLMATTLVAERYIRLDILKKEH